MSFSKANQWSDCWVDVFSGRAFEGRLLRLRLPEVAKGLSARLRLAKVRSIIVGPGVRAMLRIPEGPQTPISLDPNKLIADLAELKLAQPVASSSIELIPLHPTNNASRPRQARRRIA